MKHRRHGWARLSRTVEMKAKVIAATRPDVVGLISDMMDFHDRCGDAWHHQPDAEVGTIRAAHRLGLIRVALPDKRTPRHRVRFCDGKEAWAIVQSLCNRA